MVYFLTAFAKDGASLLNERFDATSDIEAMALAKDMLAKNDALERTHRLTRSGKLLLFAR
ncbi:YhzD family protein [Shouchella lonarensis]|nr:YhzD family protein [Shouchella lonarensis]